MKKIIIGVTGEIASGKDTVTQYLEEKYSAKKYRFSDTLRGVLSELGLEETRLNLHNLSTALRHNYGENILAQGIQLRVIRDTSADLIVIDGIRRKYDMDFFVDFPGFVLIYVSAPIELRYERTIKRHQNADDQTKTFEEFQADHERETETTILALKEQAKFVIENTGSLEDLQVSIEKILEELDVTKN
ncbi:MAG: AAA family ATPase [Patescibacteria group bacterium]